MKCSEYLWKYVELQRLLKGESPERVQGEMRTILGQEMIVSDTTGQEMTEREARSVLGRNEKALWDAYRDGSRARFALIVTGQQGKDDAYHAEKAEQEGEGERPSTGDSSPGTTATPPDGPSPPRG